MMETQTGRTIECLQLFRYPRVADAKVLSSDPAFSHYFGIDSAKLLNKRLREPFNSLPLAMIPALASQGLAIHYLCVRDGSG